MAVPLASGVVVDTAKAVEPAGHAAARAAAPTAGAARAFAPAETAAPASVRADETAGPEAFKRFEAMVLKTFIESMLPADGGAVYGKGLAGDMWKSMMAEKVAEVMAERGGIGIAERVLGGHYAEGRMERSAGALEGRPTTAPVAEDPAAPTPL